jgi:hypothetical protein
MKYGTITFVIVSSSHIKENTFLLMNWRKEKNVAKKDNDDTSNYEARQD